jgi:hypothetical protein
MPPVDEVVDRGDHFTPEPENAVVEPEKAVDEAVKTEPAPLAADATPEVAPVEKKGDENLIPRDRFNEAVLKERTKTEAAANRVKELEGQLVVQNVSQDVIEAQKQIKELIKTRNQHLADGKLDEAGVVDEKIFELQDAVADRKAEFKASQAKEAAKEEMRYDNAVSKLETDHPELDPESDSYSQDDVDEVRALMRGYQVEFGLTPSAAITRAAKRVFGSPAKAAAIVKEDETAKKAGETRKTEAVEKNLDAIKKQPASTKEVGLDHDKRGGGLDAKTVMKMNYKEFSELDEAQLSKMRGDSL